MYNRDPLNVEIIGNSTLNESNFTMGPFCLNIYFSYQRYIT